MGLEPTFFAQVDYTTQDFDNDWENINAGEEAADGTPVPDEPRSDERIGYEAAVTIPVAFDARITARYSLKQKDSNLRSADFDVEKFTVGVTKRF